MLRAVTKYCWVVGTLAWLAIGCARPVRVESSNPGSEGAAGAELASSLEVEIGAETVRLSLRITNGGPAAEAVVLRFPTAQRFEFLIRSAGGKMVWRWSEGKLFGQVVGTERLAPGETVSYEAVWHYPAGLTGRFLAEGRLTATNRSVRQSMWFNLE